MRSRVTTALLLAGAAVLAACSVDVGVTAERSDLFVSPNTSPPFEPVPDDPADPDDPTGTTTTTEPRVVDQAAIDFGSNKPPRDYDEFLLATLTDLEIWWAEQFPIVYGEPWRPLEGGVFAAYPERPDDIPGCGEPRTTYEDVQQFVAFYCGLGDFIVYDDGEDGLLFGLADNFGAGTIGIVMAHEYGHAIQQRAEILQLRLPTVVTEQQADCFAGAWAGRASRAEGGITFSDLDVRAGLIAMLEVRDPVGIGQLSPGSHGSGFDRVGAFQVGFQQGPARCAELIDDPLPLVPNQFTSDEDLRNEGNAPFGYAENELLGFLPEDLNLFWGNDVRVPGFEPLTVVPVQRPDEIDCADLRDGIEFGTALCPSQNAVYLDEPALLDLYRQSRTFGDFSVGYLIGLAWSEAVQLALDTDVVAEQRALLNDCLTGAWVQTVIPVDVGNQRQLPQPRDPERTSVVSPGDLDEAVRTAILIGDLNAADDVIGSAFEKIESFRAGILGGLDACGV